MCHFLPHGRAAVDAVGVKLHPHRFGVEVIEIDLNLEHVLLAFGLYLYFAEVQRGPFLRQCLAPLHHLRAQGAFIGGAPTIG